MKITALLVLKAPSGGVGDPVVLANESDVSQFGYFQRSAAKEFILFVARTIAKRTLGGQRQSVEQDEYMVYCYNRSGLCGLAFADKEYPMRSAFSDALQQFQDPTQADTLLRIQRDLDETKVILHKTIEGVLARGELFDTLVEKSTDLSATSQVLYKQAKKANRCCSIL
ncbi:hypothetical protein R1sor_012343 [Riccia sorocarpa]|uniref:Synaptobrevin-like protein n=1 Tax=Riccia sorocarpa TaxID=122646 RepID=A0ABD3I3I1_9MARC